MSRAIILPTPADPFLLRYWLENFRKYYKSEVDKLYVCLNSPVEKKVIDYEMDLLDGIGADYIYFDRQIEHGEAIRRLLEIVSQDYVMLAEDDGFVFKKGKIDECFRRIEGGEYDCVGSKRGSCSLEILKRANEVWGLDIEGVGDHGCNFWPCFFFAKREILWKTDRNFGSRMWKAGEYIPELDYCMKEDGCGDTFVNTSLQLRAMGLKFYYEPQYHGNTTDIVDYEDGVNLFDGGASWTHAGSLSSGIGGVLVDDYGRPLARRLIDPPQEFKLPEADIDEWARRIQWWQTFYDNSDGDKITEFREEYRKALERLYTISGVHKKTVLKRQEIYKTLGL